MNSSKGIKTTSACWMWVQELEHREVLWHRLPGLASPYVVGTGESIGWWKRCYGCRRCRHSLPACGNLIA